MKIVEILLDTNVLFPMHALCWNATLPMSNAVPTMIARQRPPLRPTAMTLLSVNPTFASETEIPVLPWFGTEMVSVDSSRALKGRVLLYMLLRTVV